ncbi:hypothetical protein [Lysinibacillus pakistanensis]
MYQCKGHFNAIAEPMSKEQTREEIQAMIDQLKKELTGDMMKDMEIKDQIHKLEMELNQVKPPDSPFECFGCGS